MNMSSRKAAKSSCRQKHRTAVSKKRVLISNEIQPRYIVPKIPRGMANVDNLMLLCVFCNGPCIEDYVHCNICIKTYHYQCLYNLDDDESDSYLLPSFRKKDKNCSKCEDLSQFLTEDEIHLLRSSFNEMDRDQDGFIILKDFLLFCFHTKTMNSLISHDIFLLKSHFNIMDIQRKDRVAWLDYERFYTCKLIARKDRVELTTLLSNKELICAKNLFIQDSNLNFDHQRNLIITKEHFNKVLYNLILMIKKKYGGQFIDAVLLENQTIDETFEKHRVLTWEEFLCQISVPMILNRSNFEIQQVQTYLVSILPPVPETKVEFSYMNRMKNQIIITEDLSWDKYRKIEKRRSKSALPRALIVENLEKKENFERPKLKLNVRDERQTISEPWSMVKQMEHVRNEPILISITSTRILRI
ncbi:hypothetical protein I4U23_012064 [Adineta vaga]|nr:hypothetical protein I4U23_012064 [Adineta vaga]